MAQADLKAAWEAIGADTLAGEAVRDSMIVMMENLTAIYGDISATAASDWYVQVRAAAGAHGSAPIVLPEPVSRELVEQTVRHEARFLWDREKDNIAHGQVVGKRTYRRAPEKMLDALSTSLDRMVQDQARWTVTETAANETSTSVQWRRVATPGACDWCKDLAAEGWTWPSQARAEMNLFHDNCKCMVEPLFEPAPF